MGKIGVDWDNDGAIKARDAAQTEQAIFSEAPAGTAEVKRGKGRPKGSGKRKDGNTILSLCLSVPDKEFLRAQARKCDMSMADFIHVLLDRERTRLERRGG